MQTEQSEILRLYSIVHVAMETTKTSNFNRLLKSFISIFFPCQVSACELQPFSCYDLANDIYLQTAKTVFSHLKTSKTVDMYNKYPSDAVHSELSHVVQASSLVHCFTRHFVPQSPFRRRAVCSEDMAHGYGFSKW